MKIGDVWVQSDPPWIYADGGEQLPCDGSLVSRKKYPQLYLLIGHTYGDEDERCCTSELFPLPNLKEKHADQSKAGHAKSARPKNRRKGSPRSKHRRVDKSR